LKPIAGISAACALALMVGLTGCGQSSEGEKSQEMSATMPPDAKPGMALAKGQMTLPIVAGRPAAVYFELTNGGKESVTLVAAYVDGATTAEMHETTGGSMKQREAVEIAPGATVAFAQGGLHVMAFEPSEDLAEGATTELTLTFSDGDKLSAPIEIVSAGMGHDMHGMDH